MQKAVVGLLWDGERILRSRYAETTIQLRMIRNIGRLLPNRPSASEAPLLYRQALEDSSNRIELNSLEAVRHGR
jgi:hypothetical protein